ncbi:DUF4190 domain-containing protein [Kitasatospora sp. NPDC056138]|uniref:DUF4190 domain-containing protein n=1 Tax=Kitasatospora sp. NPDC056138 TaxID=3345724 RepID=UPI0035E2EF20
MAQQGPLAVREWGAGRADDGGPPLGTNRFASWARLCGLLALVPLALVFGVIGLVQVRRSGQRGKGVALTGLVAAVVWVLFLVGLADVAGAHVQRDKAGGVSKEQADSVFDLKPGDCFLVRSRDAGGGIRSVLLVPCSESHDGRVYATPGLPGGDDVNPQAAAEDACTKARPASVPADAAFGYLYPDARELSLGRGRASCFVQP